VRKLLGKPAKISKYPLKPNETHYDWRWQEAPTRTKIFTVTFDTDMRVQSTGSVDDVPPQG
jgi:hypothetical protein